MAFIKCALCQQPAEADEFGILPDHLEACAGRKSAHHAQSPKARSTWKLGRTGAGGGR